MGNNLSEELNHVGEGQVGTFGVEARTFVAHEGVLGRVKQNAMFDAGSAQTVFDGVAAFVGDVRVIRTEDHQKFALDFGSLREGASVGVFAQFSIVNTGAVKADGSADIGLKGGAKGEVPTDAETHGAEVSRGDLRMSAEPIKYGAATGVEIRDGSFQGVFEATGAARVVKRNGRAGRLDAVIDLGGSGDESITGQTDAHAKHGAGELEDVRVTEDGGKFAWDVGRSDKGSHGRVRDGNINVGGFDDHCLCFSRAVETKTRRENLTADDLERIVHCRKSYKDRCCTCDARRSPQ